MSDLGVEPTETATNAQGEEVPVDPYVVWDEETSSAVPLAQAVKPALGGVAAPSRASRCARRWSWCGKRLSRGRWSTPPR